MVEVAKLTERVDNLIAKVTEIKEKGSDTHDRLIEIEKSVSFVKGATWVFGGLFAIAIVIFGVFLKSKFGG